MSLSPSRPVDVEGQQMASLRVHYHPEYSVFQFVGIIITNPGLDLCSRLDAGLQKSDLHYSVGHSEITKWNLRQFHLQCDC